MTSTPRKKIFANCDRTEFVGRENELSALLACVDGPGDDSGLLLSCEPGSGATELLSQLADELFSRGGKIVPFYFQFKKGESPITASRRFAFDFILQTVAFLRREPGLFSIAPSISELRAISTPRDSAWIDALLRAIADEAGPEGSSLDRVCLSAPFRAAAAGTSSVILIDDFHNAGPLETTLASSFGRSSIPFVAAGYRRHQFGELVGQRIDLDRPLFRDAGRIVDSLAKRHKVVINDECRDLIAAQTGGDLSLAAAWIIDAADRGNRIESFQTAERIYAESLFGGRVGRRFDAVFTGVSGSHETQRRILGLLADSEHSDHGGIPIELWERRIDAKPKRVRRMIDQLNVSELIDVDAQSVQTNTRSFILGDYLAKRAKLDLGGENRAAVFGRSLGAFIRRAPILMSDVYRREASLGLEQILSSFDGVEVPTILIDYPAYRAELKGETSGAQQEKIEKASSFTRLPRVYFAGDAISLHRSLSEIAVEGLTAFAMGFHEGSDESEDTVWIAAEIESKLEATKEVAEYWCDHLEAVALKSNTPDLRLWLIAPEGFTDEAAELLVRRGAFGSSRHQVELLKNYLSADSGHDAGVTGEEYEFVLPMDQDAELIAARAIEDIAKRHDVEPKAVNQIKTALVEAYINASEHSLSPDRKVHQRIRIDDEKIEITISNRGIRLEDKKSKVVELDQGRRGWGLKLMRQLMDDVKVETVDDGTRITMTKYLKFKVPVAAVK